MHMASFQTLVGYNNLALFPAQNRFQIHPDCCFSNQPRELHLSHLAAMNPRRVIPVALFPAQHRFEFHPNCRLFLGSYQFVASFRFVGRMG
jgi:hypothetical protein